MDLCVLLDDILLIEKKYTYKYIIILIDKNVLNKIVTVELYLVLSISREDSHSSLSVFLDEWWQTIIFGRKTGAVGTSWIK